MRLFVAIDIDPAIRERLARFVEGMRGFAPEARWVKPESFHVTLKFLGETDPRDLAALQQALAGVHGEPLDISFRGCGFFPAPRAPRVFWVGVEGGDRLPQLARAVDEACATLGFERERNDYRAHLTLARLGARASGNPHQRAQGADPRQQRLGEKVAALPPPDFGTMTAREFFLYASKLTPAGAEYTRLQSFALHQTE